MEGIGVNGIIDYYPVCVYEERENCLGQERHTHQGTATRDGFINNLLENYLVPLYHQPLPRGEDIIDYAQKLRAAALDDLSSSQPAFSQHAVTAEKKAVTQS